MRPRLTATFVTLALLVALLAAAGCGGSGGEPATLNGTAWGLTEWTLSSLDPKEIGRAHV